MPDWSQIKSIARYFGRTGHQVYPAWLYHPTEEPRLVKNAEEAGELGVCYREATVDERGRYGLKAVWDWQDDTKWRPQPYANTLKFDPTRPGQGKTFMPAAQNPAVAQNAMIEALIPAVAAAVAQSLKGAGGPTAPANVDPAQWDEFLQFKAWQKTKEVVATAVEEEIAAENADHQDAGDDVAINALNALTPEQDRALWEQEAESRGIKVDRRWSLDRLKLEVNKAA
jgi:hypothetical protein